MKRFIGHRVTLPVVAVFWLGGCQRGAVNANDLCSQEGVIDVTRSTQPPVGRGDVVRAFSLLAHTEPHRRGGSPTPDGVINRQLDSLFAKNASRVLLALTLDTLLPVDVVGRSIRDHSAALLLTRAEGPEATQHALRSISMRLRSELASPGGDTLAATWRDLSSMLGLARAVWQAPVSRRSDFSGAKEALCALRDARAPRGTLVGAREVFLRRTGAAAYLFAALERHTSDWGATRTTRVLQTWPDSTEAARIRGELAYIRNLETLRDPRPGF